MKILVIGGGGQVGSKIIEKGLKSDFEIYTTYLTRKPLLDPTKTYQINKTRKGEVKLVFEKVKPNVVIDTAALHGVDYCENHNEEAWLVNVEGTRNVAKACSEFSAKMVFISTDYVFDGIKGNYVEEDPPNPINYYGLSKLEAEKMVSQNCNDYIIARPSVIYSWVSPKQRELQSSSGKPLNFAMWLMQKLSNTETVNIVTNQYSSPTLADSLADALLKLSESPRRGIYHITGKTRLSRYQFAIEIARKLGMDEKLIYPITTDQLRQVAKRPMDSSLNVEKIENHINLKMLMIEEALHLIKRAW